MRSVFSIHQYSSGQHRDYEADVKNHILSVKLFIVYLKFTVDSNHLAKSWTKCIHDFAQCLILPSCRGNVSFLADVLNSLTSNDHHTLRNAKHEAKPTGEHIVLNKHSGV